ncbi:hypothetical protein DOFOFD_05295 [Acetobacteraceae bacterium EV16P]|uniref:Uncharacterized protein n=1 Tax=Sorlinia euscelidii TaxID=3081148 RepID=A0ABU7U3H2_9PROT
MQAGRGFWDVLIASLTFQSGTRLRPPCQARRA